MNNGATSESIVGPGPLVMEKLVRWYFLAALGYFAISLLAGLLMALQLVNHNPLAGIEIFSPGRWRLVHTNAIAYGFIANAFLGMLHWAIPRLTRRPVLDARLSWFIFGAWQVVVLSTAVGLVLGQAQALAVGHPEDARGRRRLLRPRLRRPAAAGLAAREVDEGHAPSGRGLARHRAAHDQLRVVRVRAEPRDVEGVHAAILVPCYRDSLAFERRCIRARCVGQVFNLDDSRGHVLGDAQGHDDVNAPGRAQVRKRPDVRLGFFWHSVASGWKGGRCRLVRVWRRINRHFSWSRAFATRLP